MSSSMSSRAPDSKHAAPDHDFALGPLEGARPCQPCKASLHERDGVPFACQSRAGVRGRDVSTACSMAWPKPAAEL